MYCLLRLAICVSWAVCVRGMQSLTVTWPADIMEDKGLRNMLLSRDGEHLIISGLNRIYDLNTTDLQLVKHAVTGPVNENINDVIRIMIYNETENGGDLVTTCSSTRSHCDIREVGDISRIVDYLQLPIKMEGVVAFIATYVNHFLFVGCPHVSVSPRSGRCLVPGIAWYKNSGNDKSSTWYGFKSFEDTPVWTEKFIDGFPIGDLRIFFSLQKVRSSGERRSRIAQICQHQSEYGATAPYTYADMPITCGRFRVIRAVKKIVVGEETLFIAVFSEAARSVVCVYTLEKIKTWFVQNIKDCYRGHRPSASDDYINFKNARPCGKRSSLNETFYQPDDYYLCNKDRLESFHHTIGTRALHADPVIPVYHAAVTAITVENIGSKIVAFLGTYTGRILKAVVYPRESAVPVNQPRMTDVGYLVKKDMCTSYDKKHIFVLTQSQVLKEPVEYCAGFMSCNGCLGSKDPYCGWCFLDNRCSTNGTCTSSSQWISASTNQTCPHVKDISPGIMSDREIHELQMEVSHVLQDVDVSCIFHNNEMGTDFTHMVGASVSHGGMHVACRPTNILPIEDRIKGFVNVTVSIVTNISGIPVMNGHFLIYRCETFDRCSNCTSRDWSCKWCVYANQCIDKDSEPGCDTGDDRDVLEECPRVTNYTLSTEDRSPMDANGTVYLSKDSDYQITVTGVNLPNPGDMVYTCKMEISETQTLLFINASFGHGTTVTCKISKEVLSTVSVPGTSGRLGTAIRVMWGESQIDGDTLPVVIYECEELVKPSSNCGQCKSFATYKPYYHCRWCEHSCIYRDKWCNHTESQCGDPQITKVYPLSAHVKATTMIELEGVNLGAVFNDTVNAVTIAGIPCTSIEDLYEPGIRIVCNLAPSYNVTEGNVAVMMGNNATGQFSQNFQFRIPVVTTIKPKHGPRSGGTAVTISGDYLDTGREQDIKIGGQSCTMLPKTTKWKGLQATLMTRARSKLKFFYVVRKINDPPKFVCKTISWNPNRLNEDLEVEVGFDGAIVLGNGNVTYRYVTDPNITAIQPRKSFQSGGRILTIEGTNLYAIQEPKIYAMFNGVKSKTEDCTRDDMAGVIYCPSPRNVRAPAPLNSHRLGEMNRRSIDAAPARLGFVMDDVSSVTADRLPSNLALLMYYPNPTLDSFTSVKIYDELQESLIIKGERLTLAASAEDVIVYIGCERCNLTALTEESIICVPPTEQPICAMEQIDKQFTVKVSIGFLQRAVGMIEYETSRSSNPSAVVVTKNEYIIAGSVVGFLVLCLLAFAIAVVVMWRKRTHMKKEKVGLEYKMDKLEAKFRTQCREEFAALQTAVSDLTSDLEGGNVLFREYAMYACKTLFSAQKLDPLMSPPAVVTEQSQQAMETFKGLLRNRQFLLMLIKTLEKARSFTVHDKSNVATILMALNHNNMEYITDILTTLLNDLIDKNIASQTPKLLLRRSECVGEKLLTHWLSICLYHYLKEQSGSALYILYKAIKIQTEKGPIDYISSCGKYTLSEDKLFTSADTEINPVTLTLEVQHFDYIDNIEKQICVQVLDCDTITQAKNKMLEILYKNVPYSRRPAVHSTNLELDGGKKRRILNDEDACSVKEGLWKKINTLQHYSVPDGAKVNLRLNREMETSALSLAGASPDSYIVGSFRRSKPVVRTISGSNFWHLTKKHQTEDEVQLASDLFLPRLINTKGTLQTYIDDLFEAVLCVGEEPPIIIKYLFDFLDSSASRCGVTDPDVLHTWKCNSLLLRFWVNIIKNPEFVFDVHKPHIVDSCLSVIAQTLMDSCSTADLVLGPSSPSNKLLFAKDIPRYKTMVRQYFEEMKQRPAISDQDLNSYLTQNVSQKFSGQFNQSSALLEMYSYTSKYRNEICSEMDNLEAESPGSFSPLTSKLQYILMSMDMYTK